MGKNFVPSPAKKEAQAKKLELKNTPEVVLLEVIETSLSQYQTLNQRIQKITSIKEDSNISLDTVEAVYADFFSSPQNKLNEVDMKKLNQLSKIKEREFKQLMTALHSLKQLQAPPLQVNIKTNSANFVKNQQNNFKNQ